MGIPAEVAKVERAPRRVNKILLALSSSGLTGRPGNPGRSYVRDRRTTKLLVTGHRAGAQLFDCLRFALGISSRATVAR